MRSTIVGAIFTDYDGTIASARAARPASKVPLRLARVLERLAARLPLAIITSKDYAFVYPRTRFAHAWACLAGLEIVLKDGRREIAGQISDKAAALRELAPLAHRFEIEVKRIGDVVAGICIDWSRSAAPSGEERRLLASLLRRHGMYVIRSREARYMDAYALRPDKGRALERLKQLMGIRGAVLYMGDSELDNEAFERADISVGVCHGQGASLKADLLVRYGDLHLFLGELMRRQFLIDGALRYVRRGRKC